MLSIIIMVSENPKPRTLKYVTYTTATILLQQQQ